MIKFFSRLERTRNVVLVIFALIMVAALVLWNAGGNRGVTSVSFIGSTAIAAKVGGEKITLGDIAAIQQSRGANFPASLIVNALIDSKIVKIEAERLGLTPSDAEVAAVIRLLARDENGQVLDSERYKEFATAQAGSIRAYEDSVRDSIAREKLFTYITAGVTVSEDELVADFKKKNTKFALSYVPVTLTDLAVAIKPTDAELQGYFDRNKSVYFISETQKKIAYIYTDTVKVGQKLVISEEDLRAAYDRIPADKKKKGVEGQEIVLRISRSQDEPGVMENAGRIIQILKDKAKGDVIPEDVFAGVAKGYSESRSTAALGGRLPGLVREDSSKASDPYQRLPKLSEGQITEPIVYTDEKTGIKRIFILRRGRDIPKPFEDAKPELMISLRNTKADAANAELAQKIRERLNETKDVKKVAAEFASAANMSVTEMVRETPFIKPGDNVDKVGINPDFESTIAPLANPNDVGEKLRITGGFAVPMLTAKQDPRDATLAEVKSQVVEAVKREQAQARVEQVAKEIASSASSVGALAGVAKSKGLKAQEQKDYTLGSPLGTGPTAATSADLETAVFALAVGGVTKTPVRIGENWFVVGVTKRDEASMDNYAKERDSLLQAKLNDRRQRFFEDYLASVRQKMELDGDIVIYKEQIARLDEVPEIPGQ